MNGKHTKYQQIKPMSKSKEEILDKEVKSSGPYLTTDVIERDDALTAMDIFAKVQSIAFFKWYGAKMAGFMEYIKDIRPIVTINEIEEKLIEFEGKSFEELYTLFTQDQIKK